jgi:hypothetical protein
MIMRKHLIPIVVLSGAMAFSSVSMAGEPSNEPHYPNPLRWVVAGLAVIVVAPLFLLSWEMDKHQLSTVTHHSEHAAPVRPPVYTNNYIHGPGYVQSN